MFEAFEALLEAHRAKGSVPNRAGRRVYRSHVTANPPASADDLKQLEAWLGNPLPVDYRAFLARWDGAQLFVRKLPGGDLDPNPCLFRAAQVPHEQAVIEDDPHVLVIGQSDDESFLLLDRRQPTAAVWPVYWADETATVDEVLQDSPIAESFAEFLERFIAAQGDSYWEAPPPALEWRQWGPNHWTHGAGVGFRLAPLPHPVSPDPMFEVGFGTWSAPPALLMAAGLRNHLMALGAECLDPASINWSISGWVLVFRNLPAPSIDPRRVPPAPAREGWSEVAPRVWVHGAGEAGLWSERRTDAYYGVDLGVTRAHVSWALGQGEAAAKPLCRRLARVASHKHRPEEFPERYEAVEYQFWQAQLLEDIRP